ncbi:MAG: hypothetical protein KKH44_04550, partial [Bacteroidetes bacterium]|nr:hypothetical protein [Bacteroidota bacterium]
LSAEANTIETDFDNVTTALRLSGSQKGRDLVSQKLTLDKSYELLSVKSRAKATKGTKLTEKESQKFEQLTKEVKTKDTEIQKLQSELEEAIANNTLKQGTKKKYSKMTEKQKKIELESLKLRAKELIEKGC